ncbi:MAG: dihydrolipoyllysine-residue acetyltransferase [Gammaproteobacteria bacterium]
MTKAKDILLPDIGDFDAVEIIDIAVSAGDTVAAEDTLLTLESDKATMDIPSPQAGIIGELKVKVGDQVSQGAVILTMQAAGKTAPAETDKADTPPTATAPRAAPTPQQEKPVGETAPPQQQEAGPRPMPGTPSGAETAGSSKSARAHASPAVRKFARELGVNLGLVRGSGDKGRILKQDVKAFTKAVLTDKQLFSNVQGGFALPEIPPVDFSRFGPVTQKKLTRLKRLAGQNLHRSWITAPHVTQFDETDITELEEFRQTEKAEAERRGSKLTLLSFLVKAVVVALKKYPEFNASLSPDGKELILKDYYHIGFAVNTAQGLMVPVLKDADQKGLVDLAIELAELAQKARDKKLSPADMQGGCFTISSLGHIGGTGFTPIINTPELAIMGVSRSRMQPVYIDGKFEPRLTLPYSVSYDHRVIDGVAAAEFTRYLGIVLTDIRQVLL